MAAKKNELVAVADFDLVTISGDIAEAIAEEMDGLGAIPFDRVKIPSGGGLAFEVPREDGENPETTQELVGVILYHHPVNAYWVEKFSGSNEQPDCSSMDGKQGIVRETGEIRGCADCPYNKFGSDGGLGKACKNVHRVYILREGNPVPLILSLPPTSLKYMRDYIGKRILLKGMRCYDAITKITLKKEKNAVGIAYSRAVFAFAGKLPDEKRAAAAEMAVVIRQSDQSLDVEDADYNTAPPAAETVATDDGFMNIPDGVDDDLPFN